MIRTFIRYSEVKGSTTSLIMIEARAAVYPQKDFVYNVIREMASNSISRIHKVDKGNIKILDFGPDRQNAESNTGIDEFDLFSGMLGDKDITSSIKMLMPYVKSAVTLTPNNKYQHDSAEQCWHFHFSRILMINYSSIVFNKCIL